MIQNVDLARSYIKDIVETLPQPYKSLCESVTLCKEFWTSPASKPESGKHHNYPGGLAVHTAQVLEGALDFSESIPCSHTFLVVAAIWHDAGKMKDYSETGVTTHYTMIKHLSSSYAMFYKEATAYGLINEEIEMIGHMILAHHGRHEWGSPVEPKTPEAWILHAADMLSAHYLGKESQ